MTSPVTMQAALYYFALIVVLTSGAAQAQSEGQLNEAFSTMGPLRAPFQVAVQNTGGETVRRTFGRVPYVRGDWMFLFMGEHLGFDVKLNGEAPHQIIFQPELRKALLEFEVSQKLSETKKHLSTILTIKNRSEHTFRIHALLSKASGETVIAHDKLIVEPKTQQQQLWEEPLMQIVLKGLEVLSPEQLRDSTSPSPKTP